MFRMQAERPHTEDILIYKSEARRKTRLSLEEEYLHELQNNFALETIKRRCFDAHQQPIAQRISAEDVPMVDSKAI